VLYWFSRVGVRRSGAAFLLPEALFMDKGKYWRVNKYSIESVNNTFLSEAKSC
jgi:hypothetical protein